MASQLFRLMATQILSLDAELFHQRLSLLLHGAAREDCAGRPQWVMDADGIAPGCDCFEFVLSAAEQAAMQGDKKMYPLLFVGLRNRLTRNLLTLIWETRRDWLAAGAQAWLLHPLPYRALVAAWQARWPTLYLDMSIISRLMLHTTVQVNADIMPLRALFPSRGQWLMHNLRRVMCAESQVLHDAELAQRLGACVGESISVSTLRRLRHQAGIPSYQDRQGLHYGSLFGDRPGTPFNHDVLISIPAAPAVYEFLHPDTPLCYPQGQSSLIYIGSSHHLKRRMCRYLGGLAHTQPLRDAIAQGVLLRHVRVENPRHSEAMLLDSFVGFYGALPHLNRIRPKNGGCGSESGSM